MFKARNWLVRLVRQLTGKLEIDKALVFAVLAKAWQALAGIISLFFIARFFSPETQGFYYTFTSLLALQSFVELGFYIVIINVASHEWAHLKLDREGYITGDPSVLSRLASLGYLVGKWYAIASILFAVGAGLAGYAFFSQEGYPSVLWEAPWWSVVVLTGLTLWGLPFISLLEGCNQVVHLNKFRLVQAILGNVVLWATIFSKGGLWAAVFLAGMNVVCTYYLLFVRYKNFFLSLLRTPKGPSINWSVEVWPMQWRLALQGLVNYFMFSLFTPVLFHYHGAKVAGQMGMTWQVVNMLQSLAMAWIQTKVPTFGALIARNEYDSFYQLWRRVSRVSVKFVIMSSGLVWLLVYCLNALDIPLAQRLLHPLPTGLLLLAVVLAHIVQCQAAYLRAHKKEALLVSGVASGIVTGLLVWWLGRDIGATGAALAYLLVVSTITLPATTLIWIRFRSERHKT